MGSLTLNGATSGQITINPPAVAGTNTLTLPATTDTVTTNAATQTLTNKTLTSPTITGASMSSMASSVITSGTAVASTSGTSIDFTGIPSWVKRITVMFNGVSTNGGSNILIQLGSGSFTTTGYISYSSYLGTSSATQLNTTGFGNPGANAGNIQYGQYIISNFGSNTWVYFMSMGVDAGGPSFTFWGGGRVAIGGTLDRVRITTVNGTDTFDAGSINILYE